MKNRLDRLDHDTEQLLLQKSYHQLTMEEARSLEGKFSEASYYAARKTLLTTRKMFARDIPMPDPQIKSRLQKIVAAQKNKTVVENWWSSLFNYRVPVWQPVAGLSLVLLYLISPWTNTSVQSDNYQNIVYKTDTIYRDKPVFVKSTIPAATTPRIRQASYLADNEDSTERNSVLDTLQGVAREIRSRLPIPATNNWMAPVMQLSDTAIATFDTASISARIEEGLHINWKADEVRGFAVY